MSINSNGSFVFSTALDDAAGYLVSVLNQPTSQSCSVTNGSGSISAADVIDVQIDCATTQLSLSISVIDFGVVTTELSARRTISITNIGISELLVSSLSVPNVPFFIVGGSCLNTPISLQVAESCDIIVEFRPVSPGNYNDSFIVVSNAVSSPDTLILQGVANAPLAIPTLSMAGLGLLIGLRLLLAYSIPKLKRRN